MKHWIKELGRRKVKRKKEAESDEKWERAGFKKTVAGPPVYWRENNKEQDIINTRTQHEWQNIVADAKRAEHRVYLKFKIMEEFEGKGSENG